MAVREVDPSDRPALKRFVRLERELLEHHVRYVSEIDADVRRRLTGGSAFHRGVEQRLLVAADDGRDVARCAAFVNRRWQEFHGEAAGFIGYFAAAPRAGEQVREMLGAAEAWLARRGMTRVIAPYNAAAMLGFGLRTDAFDEDPMFPFAWAPPYYAHELERAGYEPAYPLWFYEIDFAGEAYREGVRRAFADPPCRIRPLDPKRWDEEIDLYLRLFNEGFAGEWEMHPYTPEEFREMFAPTKRVLDPGQILFAEVDGEPAGLCSGFPDWTPLMRSFRGRMGPRQMLRFRRRAKRYDRAGLVSIALPERFRGRGISHALAATLFQRLEELGLKSALYYMVNDVNVRSRAFAESFGGQGRILYHVYDRRME